MADKSAKTENSASELSFEDRSLELAYRFRDGWRRNQSLWTGIAVAVLCVAAVGGFWTFKKAGSQSTAHRLVGLGMVAMDNDRPDSALAIFQRVTLEHGGLEAAKAGLLGAGILFDRGDVAGAVKLYQRALDEGAGFPLLEGGALRGLAACHIEQGQFAQAADELSKVLSKFAKASDDAKVRGLGKDKADDLPKISQTMWQLVLVQSRLGKLEEARKTADRLVRTYPESDEAAQARKWMGLFGG